MNRALEFWRRNELTILFTILWVLSSAVLILMAVGVNAYITDLQDQVTILQMEAGQ